MSATKKSRRRKKMAETIMIVDVQKAFPMPVKLIERIRDYSARFHRRIFTQFVNPPGSLYRRSLKQRCCAPGSKDTELLITPAKGELVFVKPSYGLQRKDIAKLHRLGVKRVLICGMDTDACILGVMFSLFDAGIECRAIKHLCWSSNGLHGEAMKIIAMQFVPPK